jgi:putative tricarboxylic transport membrane protein
MNRMKRRSLITGFVLAVFVCAIGIGTAFGAGFPEKPITLIVHAGAGGGSDMFARTYASGIEKGKFLSQPVMVENKPGGSGGIAFAYVAGKKKDPYYIVTATPTILTTPIMGMTPVGLKDFTPIANLAFDEFVVMVGPNSKYKSLKELLADAKANPKKVTLGGTMLGGPDSMCANLVEKAAGVQFNYVSFAGGGEMMAALLGGHVDMSIGNPGEALDLQKAGKVKIFCVFSEKRLAGAPEIPTAKEQGLNVLYVQNRGIAAPADIPADARKVLEEASFKYANSETFKKYCKDNMLTEAWMDGVTFGKFLDEWNGKYAAILKEMNLIKKK